MTTPNPALRGVLSAQSAVASSGRYAVMVACVELLPTRKMTSASAFVFTASIGVSRERWSARHAATGLSSSASSSTGSIQAFRTVASRESILSAAWLVAARDNAPHIRNTSVVRIGPPFSLPHFLTSFLRLHHRVLRALRVLRVLRVLLFSPVRRVGTGRDRISQVPLQRVVADVQH